MKSTKRTTRLAEVRRQTKETDVRVKLNLDGSGKSTITSGLPFLDHMLELFAKHGLFDLSVNCRGAWKSTIITLSKISQSVWAGR